MTATSTKLMMLPNTAVPVKWRCARRLGSTRKARRGPMALWRIKCSPEWYGSRLLTTSSDSPRMLTPWFEGYGPRGATMWLTIWAGSTRNGETQKRAFKWLSAAMRIQSGWLERLKTGPAPRSAAQGAALRGD